MSQRANETCEQPAAPYRRKPAAGAPERWQEKMKLGIIEKIGSIGSLIAALACPACFPIFAVVGAALGLGVLQPFESVVFIVFRILVLVALVGNILAYWKHRRPAPLIVGVLSPALIFFTIYVLWNSALLYLGLFGLLIASVMNYIANRKYRTCAPTKGNPS